MSTQVKLFFLVGIFLIATACQSAKELHYFKCKGNYYRIQIRESSFASKARYLSGHFDEKAVDNYFGEMSQPNDSVRFISSDGSNINEKTKLVLILSSNSNSISDQIGALADNEDLLYTIAKLANKDKITESNILQEQIQNAYKQAANVITAGDSYIGGMDPLAQDGKKQILDFLLILKGINAGSVSNLDATINEFKK
ncbi:MAG: hypothetical protein ACXVPN_00395 [Bacteroidia bacterium]